MPELDPSAPEGMFDTEKGLAHITALREAFNMQAYSDDSAVTDPTEDDKRLSLQAAEQYAREGLRLCAVHNPEFHTKEDVTPEESSDYLNALRGHWLSNYPWYY